MSIKKNKNKKIKILLTVGARPNFIKVAPLFDWFERHKKEIEPILVHTGQHYDYQMSQIFFEELALPKPKYFLGVGSSSHAQQTGKIMTEFEKICFKEKPHLGVVFGDVNSTLASALVLAKLGIALAHIEAGERSFDRLMPEEINRVVTDHVSDLFLCSSQNAVLNLKNEGVVKNVFNVGDLNYDMFLRGLAIAQEKSDILKHLRLEPKSYFLLTIHRASNVDNLENLQNVISAVMASNELVIFPIHPRTKAQLTKLKIKDFKNLKLIEPVGYLDMLMLEKNSKKILTDSGGVQKEAYFARTPCITLRDRTEWLDTLADGWNVLVGQNKQKIYQAMKSSVAPKKWKSFSGNGQAAEKIIQVIFDFFNQRRP